MSSKQGRYSIFLVWVLLASVANIALAQRETQSDQQFPPYRVGISISTSNQGVVTITKVYRDTPAAWIGLQEGDEILGVDGIPIQSNDELIEETQYAGRENGGGIFTIRRGRTIREFPIPVERFYEDSDLQYQETLLSMLRLMGTHEDDVEKPVTLSFKDDATLVESLQEIQRDEYWGAGWYGETNGAYTRAWDNHVRSKIPDISRVEEVGDFLEILEGVQMLYVLHRIWRLDKFPDPKALDNYRNIVDMSEILDELMRRIVDAAKDSLDYLPPAQRDSVHALISEYEREKAGFRPEPIRENIYTYTYNRLGIQVTDYMQYGDFSGAIVVNVAKDIPEQLLQIDDIILDIEGIGIYSGTDGLNAFQIIPLSQEEVSLTFLRDDEVVSVSVDLHEPLSTVRWMLPASGVCGLTVADGGAQAGLMYTAPLEYLIHLLDQGPEELLAEFEAASASDEPRLIHTLTKNPWCTNTHVVYVQYDLLEDRRASVLTEVRLAPKVLKARNGRNVFFSISSDGGGKIALRSLPLNSR